MSIRLSNNGNMAIEHVNLLNRQPKACYFQMYTTNPLADGDSWHHTWTTTPMQPIAAPVAPIVPAPPPVPAAPHAAATHVPVSPGTRSFAKLPKRASHSSGRLNEDIWVKHNDKIRTEKAVSLLDYT